MILRILISVFFLLTGLGALRGQDVDSLFSLWKNASGKERTALQKKILGESVGTDRNAEAAVLSAMCSRYMELEDYDAALECALSLLPLREKAADPGKLADCLNELGVICQRKGLLGQAISYMERVYRLDLASADPSGMSSTMNNLAALYLAADQDSTALGYILEAIDIERGNGDRERLAIRLGLASDISLKMGDAEAAFDYVEEAYRLDSEDGREVKSAIRLSQKASVLLAQGRGKEAEECILRTVPVLEQARRLTSLAICQNQLGGIYADRGLYKPSAEAYGKALAYASSAGSDYVRKKALGGLWEAQKHLGRTSEALGTLEQYCLLSEKLAEDRVDSAVEDFRVKYETKQKEEEILTQRALGKARLKIIFSLTAVLLLLTGILLISQWTLSIRKRQARTLAGNLEVKNRLLSLVPAVSDAGESVRLKEIIDDIETMEDVPSLTRREKEVVSLCREGLSNKEIADRLKVSVRTVDAHKANIFKKLGISSTVELVSIASHLEKERGA